MRPVVRQGKNDKHRPVPRQVRSTSDSNPGASAVLVCTWCCPRAAPHQSLALLSGQETLPFEEWNLASLRLRNHHLTTNHRTERTKRKTSLKNHNSGHESSIHSREL